MKCLVVVAHPLSDSLCHSLAQAAIDALHSASHEVVIEDLCQSGFSASLTKAERRSYYSSNYDSSAVEGHIARLLSAEALVLVFPTWWFGFPAVLKGWFDRIWAPGIAYDHADDYGPIRPRLPQLRNALAVTSLGSPWWVDRLVLRQPVRRVLKTALLGTCAPHCRFNMISLYRAERVTDSQIDRTRDRIRGVISAWK